MGGLGGIGRSRARVFDAERPDTTFADVGRPPQAILERRPSEEKCRCRLLTTPVSPDLA
jgi:hypothetical protein